MATYPSSWGQGSPVWGTVIGMSALGSRQEKVLSRAEVSSAHPCSAFVWKYVQLKPLRISKDFGWLTMKEFI